MEHFGSYSLHFAKEAYGCDGKLFSACTLGGTECTLALMSAE